MENPETYWQHDGMHDTRRRQTKYNKTPQKTKKMSNIAICVYIYNIVFVLLGTNVSYTALMGDDYMYTLSYPFTGVSISTTSNNSNTTTDPPVNIIQYDGSSNGKIFHFQKLTSFISNM